MKNDNFVFLYWDEIAPAKKPIIPVQQTTPKLKCPKCSLSFESGVISYTCNNPECPTMARVS